MKSSDERVLWAALASLKSGHSGWLFTIAGTHGASPRPLGSLMWMDREGEICGSLSGGCIEDDLLEKLRSGELVATLPEIVEYGVTAEENERFGLPCGGRMRILVEALDGQHITGIEQVLGALEARQLIRRRVLFSTPQWQLEATTHCENLLLDERGVQQDFGPHYQLLLVGANELARCIAEIANAMDYRVLVCDPREDRCAQWSVANTTVLQQMPDDAVAEYATDRHSIVITLTHDPRIDDMALMQALTEDLFYVGALGSERTSLKRRDRLLELGLTVAQIAQLHAPVGLPIGSKSAMEIAVAIIAELTALRRGRAFEAGELVGRQ